ncbi:MAG: glycosyltransferase family 9 protein [Chlamydiia bacterium]|nr:glycosyltransferase family 9 protein [Chlamydiia bacterium]
MAVSLKNSFILFLVKILRKILPSVQQQATTRKELLVVSTTALGDTLWALPAIQALKIRFPSAQISVLTSQIGQEVLLSHPDIDRILVLKKPLFLSLIQNYLRLRKKYIDSIYIFHTSQRAVLPLCYLLNSKEIVGTPGINKGLDVLINKKMNPQYEHEIDRRLRIVGYDTARPANPPLTFKRRISNKNNGLLFLSKHKLDQKPVLIGINPGSKDKFKQWDPECFITLGKLLKKDLDCAIIITGGRAEQKLTSYIANGIPGAVPIDEVVSLDTLATLIEKCTLFITNDTGPMHLAFATGTKTLSLFTATDPYLCGPWTSPHGAVIQAKTTCFPCIKKKCHLPFCMLQISPQEVHRQALQILHRFRTGNT